MPETDWRARLRGSLAGNLAVLLVAALSVAAGAWVVLRPDADAGAVSEVAVAGAAAAPRVGEVAPGFTATALDSTEVSLSDHVGRPVWLVFMASWCSGCRAETPDVQAAHEQAGPEGVEVIAIYLGEDADTVQAWSDRLGLTFTQVPDPQTRLSAAYGVRGVPAHYFIDGDGIVRASRVGVLSPEQMADAVATAS